MKKLAIVLLAFFAVNCTFRSTDDPVNTSETIPSEQISIGGVLAEMKAVSKNESPTAQEPVMLSSIEQLMAEAETFKQTGKPLGKEFQDKWEELNEQVFLNYTSLAVKDAEAWMGLNDSLLKYSQDVRFADALEFSAYNVAKGQPMDENRIKSFLYTKFLDRIYVNLYGSSALQYEHTTGGVVRIVQDTNYPFDGKVILKIELQDKRYLDVFVRIPEWANIASVTVKGVKYNVVPGQYAEIAKKWKNGDEIEIIIGLRPVVAERENPKAFALTYGPLLMSYSTAENHPLVFGGDDPIRHLQFVSPANQMPTFTFSGIKDSSLVLQPLFAEKPEGLKREVWIGRE